MGRPGLDPGTLGFEPGRTEASVVVRVAWSEDYACAPTSADILSNLLPWLHDWLHNLGCVVSSTVQVSGPDGLRIEVRVEGASSLRWPPLLLKRDERCPKWHCETVDHSITLKTLMRSPWPPQLRSRSGA